MFNGEALDWRWNRQRRLMPCWERRPHTL